MLILAPSILGADFKILGEQVEKTAKAGAQYVHLDVMDGDFVPSISFGMPVIASLRSSTAQIFDVHMMVREPGRYIDAMKAAGADIVTVHAEACTHLDRTVNQIKEAGMKAGVVLNPATPLSVLDCILPDLDMVLLMTVNPGFGGQKFIPYTLEKIRSLRRMCEERGLKTDIEVDGGVTCANVRELIEAGANVFVAGSAVFNGDVSANTASFMKIFEEYER